MAVIVILFFFIIFLGFFKIKRLIKQVIKNREILEAEKEPLLGYEKCSPQFQAYMRKEIKAGRKKPQKYPQGNFENATYGSTKPTFSFSS